MTNPVYGIAGIRQVMEEKLKDPKHLPLIIGIDAFMNETTALADYIVPDTHNFESWGLVHHGLACRSKPAQHVGRLLSHVLRKQRTASQFRWRVSALL